jgi:predicted nucleotidyltransferase component of viral defense system
MIPQANITAWRAVAPWIDDAQVEQDLILSRALIEIFEVPTLAESLALRGGTSLNKLFIQPPCRYSEDIDLVQATAAPIGPVINAIRGTLDPWLGKPARKTSKGNTTLTYRFDSEIAPVRPLRLKIEINTREHFTVFGYRRFPFAIDNPWFAGSSEVVTYDLDELMGTKLRALYQRRKSRDLFDLWLTLDRNLVSSERIMKCFRQYMAHEGHPVSRADFEKNLREKEASPDFMDDIAPLLNANVQYDPTQAMRIVRSSLIERLDSDEPGNGS